MNNGNPKKKSQFICLKCGNINHIGDGIQRKKQREKGHIKNMYCLHCNEITYNVECRSSDWMEEIKEQVPELHKKYYEPVGIGTY